MVNRIVDFIRAPALSSETDGRNNTWIYHRAPDGYLFELLSADIITATHMTEKQGIIAIYDGHEYTHWNQWPGVESRELIGRIETMVYNYREVIQFNGWECKEFTVGCRSTHNENAYKACVIVWFYLKKASRDELLEYAMKHPKDEDCFKRSLRGSTVETEEL